MQCDHCGERPAAIHLTQIVNNAVTTLHLCEPCAEEKGVQTTASVAKFPLGDFLASVGTGESGGGGAAAGESEPCPSCGATLQDFRATGRLGCPACYDTFGGHLRDLLRRIHGATQHVGSAYRPPGGGGEEAGPSLNDLRRRLRAAVAAENFELAAELRDRIRVLE